MKISRQAVKKFVCVHVWGGGGGGDLYSAEYGITGLRNKRKSHSKLFVIVYSLYNVLIYTPHLVENTNHDSTDPWGDL